MDATVIAYPVETHWAVECSICGPVCVADANTVDDLCADHLAQHVEVLA